MAATRRPELQHIAGALKDLYAPGGIPIVPIPLWRNPFQDACRRPRPGTYSRKATSPAYTAVTQCTPRVTSDASLTVGRALATPANNSYRRRRSGSLKPEPTWPTTCHSPSGPRPASIRDPIRPCRDAPPGGHHPTIASSHDGLSGAFTQFFERPGTLRESTRFDTMPSTPLSAAAASMSPGSTPW